MSRTGHWINCPADRPEIVADKALAVPSHLIIVRTSYAHGHVTPIHQHQHARFLQSISGVVVSRHLKAVGWFPRAMVY